jgi:[methyl-Co(III) methanol-specific corrinoid protein]:coenzyme M methyltransferase
MEGADVFWPEALRQAEPMAKLAMGCQKAYGFESIRLPFDINVEAETMGCATRYGGVSDPPMSKPKKRDELDQLVFPGTEPAGRMAETIKATRIVSESKDLGTPLIVALGSPFEVLCTVYEFDQLYEDLLSRSESILDMLEKIVPVQIEYAGGIMSAGADVMMIVDGTSQTLMPDQFKKFSAPFTKRIIDTLDCPSILHICGNPIRIIKDMAATGASGLSIDWQVPVEKARADTRGKCALIGALDVQRLFSGGPEDAVEMVNASRDFGFDIIAPGCGIMPETPIENILAYANAVKAIAEPNMKLRK